MTLRALLCALCLLVLCVGRAGADPADQLYKEGLSLYQAAQYGPAIRKFQAAYDLRDTPRILLDIGQCYLKVGNGPSALFFFRLYLKEDLRAPATVKADVELMMQQAQTLPEAAHVSAPLPPPVRREVQPVPKAKAEPVDVDWNARPAARRPARPAPEAPPAPIQTVPVGFSPMDHHTGYAVTAGGHACATPCLLNLQPGPTLLQVQGPATFEKEILVPGVPAQVKIQHFRAGPVIAGAILTPIGLILGGVGLSFLVPGSGTTGILSPRDIQTGVPLLIVGTGLFIGGIVELAMIRRSKAEVIPLLERPAEE